MMSQHHSQADNSGPTGPTRTHRGRVGAIAIAAFFALGSGLAACGGDDDDASDTTETPTSSSSSTTTSELPPEITADPTSTTGAATPEGGSSDASDGTTDGADSATSDAASDAALTADSTPDGSAAGSGPTTTGPTCEFAENAAYPIERCNMGPAVAVIQSVLQAAGYDVSTVDGMFGDETFYAVQAFQEAEGLTVDGIVGEETWNALDPQGVGNDDNGNGVIDPDEVDLTDA